MSAIDDPANRPDDYGIVPCSIEETTQFVEQRLNVSLGNAGAIVQSHHEVFYQWKRRIEAEELATPFKVVHVDAHSDLGMGSISWPYLHSEFLDLKVGRWLNKGTKALTLQTIWLSLWGAAG